MVSDFNRFVSKSVVLMENNKD